MKVSEAMKAPSWTCSILPPYRPVHDRNRPPSKNFFHKHDFGFMKLVFRAEYSSAARRAQLPSTVLEELVLRASYEGNTGSGAKFSLG